MVAAAAVGRRQRAQRRPSRTTPRTRQMPCRRGRGHGRPGGTAPTACCAPARRTNAAGARPP
uniref:Uncharacterized protein n=1 Tax=Arundo donax TaxID=35708 RepID=A0A0A9E035_ARUDO